MGAKKYEFVKQPKEGEFGEWITADGYKCYTDNRATAVRWYKNHLDIIKRRVINK